MINGNVGDVNSLRVVNVQLGEELKKAEKQLTTVQEREKRKVDAVLRERNQFLSEAVQNRQAFDQQKENYEQLHRKHRATSERTDIGKKQFIL